MICSTFRLALLGFTVAATAFGGSTNVAQWPRWMGPQGTGHVARGEPVPEKLPSSPKLLWRLKIGEGLASPVVSEGALFYFDAVMGKETLHALDLGSGRELWKATIDETFRDSQGPAGPRCTPVVDDGHVYALSCKGELQCRRVQDGTLVWRTNFTNDFGAVFVGERGNALGAARHGNNGSPLIDGDRLFAVVGGANGAGVVCFDKRTGTVVWKSQEDQAAYAPPVMATIAGYKQLVCFTVEGLIGLQAEDGKLLWRAPMKTAFGRHVMTPVIFEDLVVAGSHQVGLVATRIVRDGEGLKAEEAWASKELAINFSSPVLVDQFLYGLGPNKNLICVEVPTGKLMWSQDGYFNTSADKAFASFLVMNRNLLMLTDGGELVLFEAEPSRFGEISRAQVCGLNWCQPAYVAGRLYVRDGIKSAGELYCIDLLNP